MIEENDTVLITDRDSKFFNYKASILTINHWSRQQFYCIQIHGVPGTYCFPQESIKKI